MNRISKKLLVGLFFLGFVLSSTQAYAYFKLAKKDVEPRHTTMASDPFEDTRVAQVGKGSVLKRITSKGNDLPLEIVLEMFLPSPAWSMESTISDQRFLNQKVTWDHYGTWIDGLEKMGGDHGLNFLVNWSTRTVYVSDTEFKEASPSSLMASKKKDKQPSSVAEKLDQIHAQVNQPAVTAVKNDMAFKKDAANGPTKSSVVATKEILWSLEKGSLKKQLEEWCQKSGYQLNWLAPYDWMISTNAEFTGSFDLSIETLIRELYNQNAGITAELYTGNKVLVIKGE